MTRVRSGRLRRPVARPRRKGGNPGPVNHRDGADAGRALIEVVFAAVLLLIPAVYILIGMLRVQAATLAVAQAARDAGRLIETATQLPTLDQVTAVATVALTDQQVPADRLRIVTVMPGGDCAEAVAAELIREPGLDYDLCVIAVIDLPGVPTVLTGEANTVTGVYTVHIDPIREGAQAAAGP